MPMFVSRTSFVRILLAASFCGSQLTLWAESGDCDQCGCHRIKKVTRLVKTNTTITTPRYQCTSENAFFPKKGIVRHCKKRCEANNVVCGSNWLTTCPCEQCMEHHETCEIITHEVRKSHWPDDNVCSTSEHHDSHVDYDPEFNHRVRVKGCPTLECQVNRGASACGCFKNVCLSKPSGEDCTFVVPEVKWVTFNVCGECDHCWAAHE
jgi:hypothetical protein